MKEIEPTITEMLRERMLREREHEVRNKELADREQKLQEQKLFNHYKEVFDTEYLRRNNLTTQTIFLNESLEKAERSLKQSDTNYRKLQTPEILYRINAIGKYIEYLKGRKNELEQNSKEETPKEETRKKELTEKLLAIHFLQNKGLFPTHNPSLGQTQKQFEIFVSNILNESEDAIKKGFQRVRKIVKGVDVVKENKTDRLKQLNTVKNWFDSINEKDISKKIETLIEKINNTPLK